MYPGRVIETNHSELLFPVKEVRKPQSKDGYTEPIRKTQSMETQIENRLPHLQVCSSFVLA